MNLSAEDKLLIFCSRLEPTEFNPEIDKLLSQSLDWKDIVGKARLHTVSPLLYHNLRQYEPKVPKDAFQSLQSLYYANMIRNRLTFKNLKNLLQLFKEESIELILLKGAALAEEIYGDLALRIMVDVDILVKRKDINRVEVKLNEIGYMPCGSRIWSTGWHHITPYMSPDRSAMIEIHTDIVPSFSERHIDLDRLWMRARPIKVSGVGTLALSIEDLILHLCLHLSLNHRFDVQLIQLCDICEAIRFYKNVDWNYIIETATQSGVSKSVYYSLLTSKRLLNAEISGQILNQFKPDNMDIAQNHEMIVEAICESILAKGEEIRILQTFRQLSSEIPIVFQELLTSDQTSKSLKILIKLIFPSKDFMRVIYSLAPKSKMVYFYYFIRPVDLAFKLAKLAVMFICKPKSVISVFKRRKMIISKSLR